VYSRSALDVRAAWSGSPPLLKLSMNSRAASAVGLADGGGRGRVSRRGGRVGRGGLPCGHRGGGHAQQEHQRQVLGPRDRAVGVCLAELDVVIVETEQHEQGGGRVRRLPELARDPEKLEEEAEPQRVVPPRAQVAERLGAGRCGAVNGQIWWGRRWLGRWWLGRALQVVAGVVRQTAVMAPIPSRDSSPHPGPRPIGNGDQNAVAAIAAASRPSVCVCAAPYKFWPRLRRNKKKIDFQMWRGSR
jgi:hypothetical protein